jgi:phosphoribosyl 1,2-cyclic phosphate phosphodiesterase
MILNALRPQPHPHHLTIEQSATYLKQINARTSLITHITHNSDHHTLQKQLAPDRIIVPWDGYTGALT